MSTVRALYLDPRFDRVVEKDLKPKVNPWETVRCCLGPGPVAAFKGIRLEGHHEEHILLCSGDKQRKAEGPYLVLISPLLEEFNEGGFIRIYGKAVILGWDGSPSIVKGATMEKLSVDRSISYKPMEPRKVKELEHKLSELKDIYEDLCKTSNDTNLKLMTKHSLEVLYWALGKAEELPSVEKYKKAKAKVIAETPPAKIEEKKPRNSRGRYSK